jgi:hypothetical protein
MTYENYKKGMFRVFIILYIPLELFTYFQHDLSFTNKFFYSLETLSQTLVIFWFIYPISLIELLVYFQPGTFPRSSLAR